MLLMNLNLEIVQAIPCTAKIDICSSEHDISISCKYQYDALHAFQPCDDDETGQP